MFCFWLVAVYGDPATQYRQSLSPFVFYDFLDASNNNNYSSPLAQDSASPSLIKFGDLAVNSNRTSWLLGAPGIELRSSKEGAVSSALTSTQGLDVSWQPTFQSGFVIELWAQSRRWSASGDFVSLSPLNTRAGTTEDSLTCNSSEPLFILRNQGASEQLLFEYSRLPTNPRQQCVYNDAQTLRPEADTQAIFIKVLPNAPSITLYSLHGQVSRDPVEAHPYVGKFLAWNISSNVSKLHFSRGNNYSTFEYNLLSFAIYPPLSEDTIYALSSAGLPNARPFAKSFKRALPEDRGGSIRFCGNQASSPRDSDCPDYSNQWQGERIMALTNSSSLKVFVVSLPEQGGLYQDGQPLTAAGLPFLVRQNVLEYRPPKAATSWFVASWTSARGYQWAKNDLTSFAYIVQDPLGLNSSAATVTLEVFPQHSTPVAANLNLSDIFAGKPMNTIELAPHAPDGSPVITEYLRSSASTTCSSYKGSSSALPLLCLTEKDRPELAYATIKSLPQFGNLYAKVEGQFVPVTVNSTVGPLPGSCGMACTPAIFIYYNSSLRNDYSDPVTFSYTVTTRLENLQLGNTRYDIDDTPTIGPEPVVFTPTMESAPAVVRLDVKDGLYAVDGESIVKQRNARQDITLSAADLTQLGSLAAVSSLSAVVTTLPTKGLLFQADGSLITAANLPATVRGNLTLLYSPNITRTASYNDSFTFYARSQGRSSPPATQTLQVLDINDAPTIVQPFNRLSFTRTGIPQSWGDLGPDTELYINFTDPDPPASNEPFYRVILNTNLNEFTIFMSEASWNLLRPDFSNPSLMIGLAIGSGVAGGGSNHWDFVANRSVALKVLNPVRMRVNKPVQSSPLTVKVEDCSIAPGRTDPRFSGPDWAPLSDSVTVSLSGEWVEAEPYLGIADMRIVYTIYGVATFVLIVLCVSCFFCCRCLYRHQRGPKDTAPEAEAEGLMPEKKAEKQPQKTEPPVRIHR